MTNKTVNPNSIAGRWNLFAAFSSEPGTTGITVDKAATGPPVKKYCIIAAPPAAAHAAANGSAPVASTTCKNGTTIAADAPFDCVKKPVNADTNNIT